MPRFERFYPQNTKRRWNVPHEQFAGPTAGLGYWDKEQIEEAAAPLPYSRFRTAKALTLRPTDRRCPRTAR